MLEPSSSQHPRAREEHQARLTHWGPRCCSLSPAEAMGACHVVTTGTTGKALCSRWGLKGGPEARVSRWMQEGRRGRAGGGTPW